MKKQHTNTCKKQFIKTNLPRALLFTNNIRLQVFNILILYRILKIGKYHSKYCFTIGKYQSFCLVFSTIS